MIGEPSPIPSDDKYRKPLLAQFRDTQMYRLFSMSRNQLSLIHRIRRHHLRNLGRWHRPIAPADVIALQRSVIVAHLEFHQRIQPAGRA
jgi:hypothetical protein